MFETLELLDRALFLSINSWHSPLADKIMWTLSQSWHTYLLVALIGYAIWKKHRARKAAEFLLGCALLIACTDISTNLVKHAVKRYRPSHNVEIATNVHSVMDENNQLYKGGKYGFFSGHAANSFGLTLFVFLCLKQFFLRRYLWLFAYPFLIAYSRVYLGVHYPSDIAAGCVNGLIFGVVIFKIMNVYFFKTNENTV